jgi:hypothetical protein
MKRVSCKSDRALSAEPGAGLSNIVPSAQNLTTEHSVIRPLDIRRTTIKIVGSQADFASSYRQGGR